MKLFIWNDYQWRLIDPTESYDKEEFFIVRKLFVQWGMKNGAVDAEISIRKHFERYGKIESIDALDINLHSASAIQASEFYEAYVTFAQSEDAYNAFMANRHGDSKAIEVFPADTWRQPGVQLTCPEDIKFLLNTEHRCNDPNWSNDENVPCDMAKVSSKDHECFCEFAAGTFHVEVDQSSGMKLKKIREIGRPMGTCLKRLVLHYNMESDDMHGNCITNDEYFQRVIQVLSTCVGEKFSEMTILNVNAISREILHDLSPLLRPLDTFTFKAESNASVIYELPAYCPNVDYLLVEANSWDGDCANKVPKHWPSISHLILKGNLNIASDTENGKRFQRFIELNPQLDAMEVDVIIDYGLCETIAGNMENLEIFAFICPTYHEANSFLDLLPGLKNLSTLSITILTVKNELGAMVGYARRLKQMKQLKTITLMQNFNPISTHHEELKKHLACTVKLHEKCECHPLNRVAEFGFDSAEVILPHDKPVLIAIVNVKDADSSAGKLLLATAIIDTFQRTMQFYPNKIQSIKMDTGDNCKYINVCST